MRQIPAGNDGDLPPARLTFAGILMLVSWWPKNASSPIAVTFFPLIAAGILLPSSQPTNPVMVTLPSALSLVSNRGWLLLGELPDERDERLFLYILLV
jgi:hypothetical protein